MASVGVMPITRHISLPQACAPNANALHESVPAKMPTPAYARARAARRAHRASLPSTRVECRAPAA
jgi:hypothetical protein